MLIEIISAEILFTQHMIHFVMFENDFVNFPKQIIFYYYYLNNNF